MNKIQPHLCKRYVDDIFCIITENSENHILETLNSFNSSIQFTIEKENKRSLPFLDILFTRNRTGFTTKVYRKPTSPTQYLHFASNSPISHKITVVRTLTKRAFTHCSSKIEYNKELKSIENQLLKSGYPLPFIKRNRYKPGTPRNNSNQYISTCYLPYTESTITIARKLKSFGIKTIFRGSPSMASILRNPITKSTDQKQKKDLVYQIPCLNCNSVYIGETSRDLSIRIKEHQRNISKLNPNSLIVDHVRETGHTPDFNNTRILHTNAKTKTQRLILEAIETMKHPKPLNKSIQLPSHSPTTSSPQRPLIMEKNVSRCLLMFQLEEYTGAEKAFLLMLSDELDELICKKRLCPTSNYGNYVSNDKYANRTIEVDLTYIKNTITKIDTCSRKYNLRQIIYILLLISGIEQNPGPKSTKQTTLDSSSDKNIRELIVALSDKMEDWHGKLETKLSSVEQGIEKLDRRIQQLETKMDNTAKSVSMNSEKIREMDTRIEFLEMKMRENNLIFHGVEGNEGEDPEESYSTIKQIIADKMQIPEKIDILQCRRLSKRARAPLLVSIPDHNERIKLFKNAFKLRNFKIYISKDYTLGIREQRRILIAKRKELLTSGTFAKLRDNKLIVAGIKMLLQFDLFTHLEKCSIFALTETWKDQHLKNKPTGFNLYESLAQRDHKMGRSSGGIIVGIREAIKDKIERTEIEKQWIMICLRSKAQWYKMVCKLKKKANNTLSKSWFDHECYIAKKIMKATLTKYIKSNRDLDRLEYVKTRNKYTSIINNKKKKYFCEIQEKLNNTYDSSEFWKTIARFRKRNYTQGNISISDWQQFYNKLLDTESIPDYEPVTMTFLNTDNELTKCITLNEISKEISRKRHGKAAGFDDIMNEAIKALPKDYLISLKDIFNRILRTSEFPTTWLKSVIQPIFKNGDPDDPSNYRGIALLSNIAKSFTSILKSRLGNDIFLIGESKNNLQIKINMLRKYFETNLLTLNENKSKIVVFRNGGRLAQNDKWFWGERQLSVTTKYLYLGYPLTSANSLNKVASHYKGKALAAIGAVWQVLTKSKMNSLNAAMRLLDSTVLPHMLYAAPCWALNQVKVVDQVQNIFLRRYLNLPKYTPGFMLRMECGRVSQEVIITKQVLRFWVIGNKVLPEEIKFPVSIHFHQPKNISFHWYVQLNENSFSIALSSKRTLNIEDIKNNVSAFVIKTGSTTQWQADLAPKEMAISDMRNRRHVQPLLTWSTNSSCILGLGALTGYYQLGQLSPGFLEHLDLLRDLSGTRIKSLHCVPISHPQNTDKIVMLACLINKSNFSGEDENLVEEICNYTLPLLLLTVSCECERRQRLHCQVTPLFPNLIHFSGITNCGYDVTQLLKNIMCEAKNLTKAERCSLFLLDKERSELVAKVFDDGDGDSKKSPEEIRFPANEGIAGFVATTGKHLNIIDAYSHPLFYSKMDLDTGFKTRNILCFPIKDANGVVGVAELCNKINGKHFTSFDEEMAQAFSIYCGISIMHSLMWKKVRDAQDRSKVCNELMMYHMQVSQEEYIKLASEPIPPMDYFHREFDTFSFTPRSIPDNLTPLAVMFMFEDLGFISRFQLSKSTLAKFILMVKKGYRDPPYHNWYHAFSVAHFSYLLLKKLGIVDNYLSSLEAFALLVAGLCHDLDHRGTTNSFQVTTKKSYILSKWVEKSRPIWLKECAESYPKGVIVACGISYEGKLKIRKVERNAKINSEYYQNNLLEPKFLNDIPSIYGKQSNKVWFHHDNATSHTSSSTQAYFEDLRQRTGINTIPKNRTPVKSPDLAPMDFCIFGCLKRALGKRHPRTIEGLWKVVKEEWDLLSMTMIRKCLLSWKIKCRSVNKQKGFQIEHLKKFKYGVNF
ncbi:PDE2A [Cordylochernes scorpioides]|uniref:Phosphodiesterase n=1 Tax=Cordylochernes scorpioides TaxID=51811 RepID=A0ABY6K0N7_9ARAC|nr:PDE2A [Cordylochernes scorpioides]